MKPRLSQKRDTAMSLFEVGLVIAVLVILVAVFLPRTARLHSPEIACSNNLKQIGLAYRIWEGDNGDISPMGVSITNGGVRELVSTGNVVSVFQVMSNELSTPRILVCPLDTRRPAIDFTGLKNANISYFIGVDVTNDSTPNPLLIFSGDSDLGPGGAPAKPGLQSFWTNDPVGWSATRHVRKGNIGLADGSVDTLSSNQLHTYFVATGLATNRLAIP
ncbi:MAG: type II secretion system protein [Verrucomicrobia bacterium]|nr:type II secretion system protein [Verrucomicrobiota bacterium]